MSFFIGNPERDQTRYICRILTQIVFEDGTTIEGCTHNISFQGGFIEFSLEKDQILPKVASHIDLVFFLPSEAEEKHIKTTGTIRHTNDNGTGVSFIIDNSCNINNMRAFFENLLSFQVNSETVNCTPDNRLIDLSQWSEDVAKALAMREGCALFEPHWKIIRTIREYYKKFKISPEKAMLISIIEKELGLALADPTFLEDLFPRGLVEQCTAFAGIPLPHNVAGTAKRKIARTQSLGEKKITPESIEIDGISYKLDQMGYLQDWNQWNEKLAKYIAAQEGITLTENNWNIIWFLRDFYKNYRISPMMNVLLSHLTEATGNSKISKTYLYELFPENPANQGARIAGNPYPQDFID